MIGVALETGREATELLVLDEEYLQVLPGVINGKPPCCQSQELD